MKTNNSGKILSTFIKIYNNKLFITIIFVCIFIFAFYNIISPVYNNSLNIEGFNNGDDLNAGESALYTGNASNSSPFDNKYDSTKLPNFSSIFDKKCLLGCVSPTSSDANNINCKNNVKMPNPILKSNNRLYKQCPWKCVPDILDKNPELKSVYAEYLKKGYPICKKEEEKRNCSGCKPDAYF
jgi:hypothetical protein